MKFPKILIDTFDNKMVCEVSFILDNILENKVNKYDKKDIIKVKKIYNDVKPIIQLIINSSTINLLYVPNNNMRIYDRKVNDFINKLLKLSIKKEVIKYFLFFFWGDYTFNNTGKKRYEIKYLYERHSDVLKLINDNFNDSKTKKELIDYLLFSSSKLTSSISGIIFNNNGKLVIVDKEKIIESLCKEPIDYSKMCVSKLIINNKKRNLDFNVESECKRKFVTVCFYNIIEYLQKLIVEDKE